MKRYVLGLMAVILATGGLGLASAVGEPTLPESKSGTVEDARMFCVSEYQHDPETRANCIDAANVAFANY